MLNIEYSSKAAHQLQRNYSEEAIFVMVLFTHTSSRVKMLFLQVVLKAECKFSHKHNLITLSKQYDSCLPNLLQCFNDQLLGG